MFSLGFTQPALVAGGNISPERFLKLSTSAAGTALQADGQTIFLIGVSERFERNTPGGPRADGYVAIADEPVPYRGPCQQARIKLGGNVTNPSLPLTSHTDGTGVTWSPGDGTSAYFGGIPLDLGSTDESIEIFVLPGTNTL